jgi:hypothetical protein
MRSETIYMIRRRNIPIHDNSSAYQAIIHDPAPMHAPEGRFPYPWGLPQTQRAGVLQFEPRPNGQSYEHIDSKR